MEEIIKYYQENKEEFFQNCLLGDEEQRQYLYNEWIRDYFETSSFYNIETCKNCNSKEITYNQLIKDSYCSDCGTWQEDE